VNSRQKTVEILQDPAFSLGGEEMGGRIRAFDWSTTPLGPIDRWPQSLRTVVNIVLSSRYQMWMAWGPELTMFYNDAYRPTLGIKHPRALGRPAKEGWSEIWPQIGPLIDTVLTTGKATYEEGLLLFLERSGFPEETYHTFSYSPLMDDNGRVNGMLCVVTEETDRLIGERRVETLRDVASALAGTKTEDKVLEALEDVLSRNKKDLPFTLTYFFDATGAAQLACSSGISRDHPLAPEAIDPGSNSPWPILKILKGPASQIVEHLSWNEERETAPPPLGDWNKPAQRAAIVPIRQQGLEQPAGFFVAATNPYRRYDAAYSGFVDLLAGQIAAALSNARVYAAERRRAEALAEIDRAKTTFFSNVSHELRTPLTLMLSPVEELLARSADRTAGEYELLDLVHRNGLRLQKLVNTLLDFSRIEAGRMQATFEPLDLGQYTAELAANFRSAMERAGLTFVIACEPLPESTYIDRDMWEKIVLNLLSNALKFTFKGMVRISLRSAGDHVEMKVEDTGTGIPAPELPHIFERFRRVEGAKGRTIEGTGIGLALVQELVKLHAGTISVDSEVGTGSVFTVSIPFGIHHLPGENIRAKADSAATENRNQTFVEEALRWLPAVSEMPEDGPGHSGLDLDPTGAIRGSERILLVDDNPDMREYVSRLLQERFQVASASNGEEALAAALADPPDLILSDVMMPGLDGFGLLAELRSRPETRTVPVILLSARAGEESRVEGLGAGADDYLIKPFTTRELLARVQAHLSMKRRREDAERSVKESQSALQSFYDSSPFLMGIAEVTGEEIAAIYVNRATAQFLGAGESMDGLTGRQIGIPAAIDQLWIKNYRLSQIQGAAIRFEYEHPRSSGNRWLSAIANYLGLGPSGVPRFSFIAEDVTEKRRADELIRRSNEELRRANADLEQFAYSASHDLQEPLRQIAVFSQLLEKKYGSKLDARAKEYLDFCVEGAHRMGMLISDLLAYSQAGRAEEESADLVDPNEFLEAVRKNLATAIVETRATVTNSRLPRVYGNAVPLTHLFQNLISNALKYRSDRAPEIMITAVQDGSYWRFAVQDNGIGIPAEFRTQIFGIFKRLHDRASYPGTGIGLAICQKIVERYGGRIWAESEIDRGSTFFFTLPMDKM
jgi:signal transduction histidine kinase/FixJ family two-component response regulator